MAANRSLLAEKLSDVRGKERSGRFRCVLALAKDGEVFRVFHGTVEGVITPSERGAGGFGYDPLFVPEGSCRTFAEMSGPQKHALSHRGRALAAAAAYLTRAADPAAA
jgi:XTP/dITP diphosphohydrolase